MVVRNERVELFLIAAGLAAAFFYFVLRALIFDVFAWILIVPILSGIYVLTAIPRYSRMRLNALDRTVLLYFLYGAFMAAIGVLFLEASKFLEVKVLIHYYFPVIFYFILARCRTRVGPFGFTPDTTLDVGVFRE